MGKNAISAPSGKNDDLQNFSIFQFDKPNPEAYLDQTNGDSLGATETIFTVMTSIVVAFISKAIL